MNKKRAGVLIALLCAAFGAGATLAPRITRASLQTLERSTDSSLESMLKDDPMYVLGTTRAAYLDGYGIVFSAEVELAPRLTPNPFRPFTKEDVGRLKETKRARVALLKEHMRTMLIEYAGKLETIPLNSRVALALTIPYSKFENSEGLPRQLVMTAPRSALLSAKAGQPGALSSVLTMQEFF